MPKIIVTLMLSLTSAWGMAEQLEISVSNIEHAKGTILVAIIDKPDDWLEKKPKYPPFKEAAYVVSSTDNVSIIIDDIPEGNYAVSIFQDLNENKKLDTNFIGYPKEPFGFSKPMGKFGPPKFEDAVVTVDSDVTRVEIKLQ
ncbi:DUF2141 domain-containing protein [Oceanicoccus sp. KOV_DT_Chl]|uniref:DUF2141 domain-containing protein n=1 Tax=Oceanicoccus sp. KOV_DT_Chl TaxID=1904639 RepID=UPI000C7A03AD|nr:DUF2141 domain-containing protein [Oceanicoccus sp. KOV_DT_Chl]